MSPTLKGATLYPLIGVIISHVNSVALAEVSILVITYPLVLLIDLKVTGVSGRPTGSSIIFILLILPESESSDIKIPESIFSYVWLSTIIICGGYTKPDPPSIILTDSIVLELSTIRVLGSNASGSIVLSTEYPKPLSRIVISFILPIVSETGLKIAPLETVDEVPTNSGNFL